MYVVLYLQVARFSHSLNLSHPDCKGEILPLNQMSPSNSYRHKNGEFDFGFWCNLIIADARMINCLPCICLV